MTIVTSTRQIATASTANRNTETKMGKTLFHMPKGGPFTRLVAVIRFCGWTNDGKARNHASFRPLVLVRNAYEEIAKTVSVERAEVLDLLMLNPIGRAALTSGLTAQEAAKLYDQVAKVSEDIPAILDALQARVDLEVSRIAETEGLQKGPVTYSSGGFSVDVKGVQSGRYSGRQSNVEEVKTALRDSLSVEKSPADPPHEEEM